MYIIQCLLYIRYASSVATLSEFNTFYMYLHNKNIVCAARVFLYLGMGWVIWLLLLLVTVPFAKHTTCLEGMIYFLIDFSYIYAFRSQNNGIIKFWVLKEAACAPPAYQATDAAALARSHHHHHRDAHNTFIR